MSGFSLLGSVAAQHEEEYAWCQSGADCYSTKNWTILNSEWLWSQDVEGQDQLQPEEGMMACGYLYIKGRDEYINSCVRKERCDGWEGPFFYDTSEVIVLSCGATKLLASLAATVATVYLM